MPSPEKFYKGGSQEKTLLLWPEFFLLPSPLDRARSVLNCRAMDSGAGHGGPAVWIFSTSGFHRVVRDEAYSFRNQQAIRWSGGDHSSIWDSWPIAFSGCPRGPRVGCETKCRGTSCLTSQLRLALEPECLQNRTATARKNPGRGGLAPKHSSCLWFQKLGVEAHSSLPYDQHDGGNFPGQGQTRHLRSHPLGQQGRVELLQWTGLGRGDDRRTLE